MPPTPQIPAQTAFCPSFPPTALPGCPKGSGSAPLGAQRVGILGGFMGQCGGCSKPLEDGISQSSQRYFGFPNGGEGFSTPNALQRLWGGLWGGGMGVPGLAGAEGPQQGPAGPVVPGILGRSAQEMRGKGCGSGTSRAILSCFGGAPSLSCPLKDVLTPLFGGDTKTPPQALTPPRVSWPGFGAKFGFPTAQSSQARPRLLPAHSKSPSQPLPWGAQPLPGHPKSPSDPAKSSSWTLQSSLLPPWPLPVGVKLVVDTPKVPPARPQPLPGHLGFPPLSGSSHSPEGHPLSGHPKTPSCLAPSLLPGELNLFLDTPKNCSCPNSASSPQISLTWTSLSPSASHPPHPPHSVPHTGVFWGARDRTHSVEGGTWGGTQKFTVFPK